MKTRRFAQATPYRPWEQEARPARDETADRGLGKPEAGARARDPEVRGERDLESAAERVAVDRRDDGDRGRHHFPRELLLVALDPAARFILGLAAPRRFLEIGPDAERTPVSGDEDDPHPRIAGRLAHRVHERLPHPLIDGVEDLGAIEAHDRNPSLGRDEDPRLRHRESSSKFGLPRGTNRVSASAKATFAAPPTRPRADRSRDCV